jgi:squalene-hopene/tetraprenyl-beta-curcumene cyclase
VPLIESNLSATLFALEALRAAGCPDTDPVFKRALVFVERCQNWCETRAGREPGFDDGGFFFIYDDPVRNKAGVAGKRPDGQVCFTSYGSTTADGLRALVDCGLPLTHPRVAAARRWLESNFRAETHPGKYAPDREVNHNAVYYYYCASLAMALRAAGVNVIRTSTRPVVWSETLADALLARQQPDGSWQNPSVAVREDDPIVATCLALGALATCREQFAH